MRLLAISAIILFKEEKYHPSTEKNLANLTKLYIKVIQTHHKFMKIPSDPGTPFLSSFSKVDKKYRIIYQFNFFYPDIDAHHFEIFLNLIRKIF